MVQLSEEQENWRSNLVKDILEGTISYEEARERRYTELDIDRFAFHRSIKTLDKTHLDLIKVLREEQVYLALSCQDDINANPNLFSGHSVDVQNAIPLYLEGGRANADLLDGFVESGTNNSPVIPIRFNELEYILKRNKSRTLNRIEYEVMNALSKDPLANVASIHKNEDSTSLFVERQRGKSLFDITYDDQISTKLGDKSQKLEVAQVYKELIRESVYIALQLTNGDILTPELKKLILEEKFSGLAQRLKISPEEAQKSYHTYKIASALGIDDESLISDFASLERLMQDYASTKSVWISDRSPRNRKNKNYDFNKIDFNPLTTELTLVLDTNPGYFSRQEREAILQYAVNLWNTNNKDAERRINFDDEFIASYDCESFYRAIINAGHCLNEAERIRKTKQGSRTYFNYARLVEDSSRYAKLAEESLADLAKRNLIPNDQAAVLMEKIQKALKSKSAFANDEDLTIDLKVYYALNHL